MTRPHPHPDSGPRHREVVERSQHGVYLLDFLAGRWPELDRTVLRNLVRDGRVVINADTVDKPRQRLRTDDLVQVQLPAPIGELRRYRPPAARCAPTLEVLHEDAAVLVVAKPAGLPAGRDKTGRRPGVLDQLEAARGGEELRLVYRPDRGASGCLLIAKDLAAAKALETALQDGRVTTEHLALVQGQLRGGGPDRQWVLDRPLGPDRRRPGRITEVEPGAKGGRDAVTQVTVVEGFRGFTLVRVRPMTWRNQQVRVHLRGFGHPIVADPQYGVRDRLLLSEIKKDYKARPGVVERPLLERMFLHIERVRFPDLAGDPADGDLTIEAPIPKDLSVVLAKLRSFAAL